MDYKNINDNELLELANSGDEEFLNILYDKYKPLIDNICNDYLSNSYFIEMDDLYQEARLAFYYAVCNYDYSKNVLFYTYVNVCIRSRLNDYVNKMRNNKNYLMNNSVSYFKEIGDNLTYLDVLSLGDDTYDTTIIDGFYDTLIDFKNSLELVEACIFELKFNGFGISEISKLLDINRKTVSKNLKSIRYKFRKIDKVHCIF